MSLFALLNSPQEWLVILVVGMMFWGTVLAIAAWLVIPHITRHIKRRNQGLPKPAYQEPVQPRPDPAPQAPVCRTVVIRCLPGLNTGAHKPALMLTIASGSRTGVPNRRPCTGESRHGRLPSWERRSRWSGSPGRDGQEGPSGKTSKSFAFTMRPLWPGNGGKHGVFVSDGCQVAGVRLFSAVVHLPCRTLSSHPWTARI
jgi:hypothetical protein